MKINVIIILVLLMLNTPFSQGFGPQQVIAPNADDPYCVYSVDIDGDGDNDILSASSNDNKIAWYRNEGNGIFGLQQMVTTDADFPGDVFSIDLDGDGDNDVLSVSGAYEYGKIAWYENLIYNASIAEKPISLIALYPNPTNDIIHIQSNTPLLKNSVFNILGELIIDMPVLNSSEITVQTQDLVNGIYIIKCYDHNSRVIIGKIIKN
ncbi:MAG: T9SS type A sorting domain-containing protein [Bacteroidetes bacterium]|nr:T9SS type A sorting domain-containing protein [Bacteroidota bacterium]MBL7104059.1 T9SS type A sorting domain-containing protein [Bacteroidales bacterium]